MKKFTILLLSTFLSVSFAFSQNFTTTNNTNLQQKQSENTGNKSVNATYFFTQSNSQTITSSNSVSCNAGGIHTDNSYFRVFDLSADFGVNESIDIESIDFGVEQAAGAGGSQPLTVNVYTLSGPLALANLTLLGTQAVDLPDQNLSIMNVPVTATIASGSVLVIEVFSPNGQIDGNSFFIGSNNLGQSDLSYLAAADCGVTEITDVAAVGFPNNHYVINVNADPTPPTIPLNSWPIILSSLLMATFIVYRIKR